LVLVAAAGRELRWLGRFLVPGLFDGEHYFIIAACPEGGVRFIQGGRFSGVLVLFAKSRLHMCALRDVLPTTVEYAAFLNPLVCSPKFNCLK